LRISKRLIATTEELFAKNLAVKKQKQATSRDMLQTPERVERQRGQGAGDFRLRTSSARHATCGPITDASWVMASKFYA